MDAIREWLDGQQNYDAGAKLYLMYGKDPLLRRVFSEPASDFKKKKLVESLKGLLIKKVEKEKKIEVTKAVAIANISTNDRQWPEVEQMDETLKALHTRWKPIFGEMMSLTSRIYDIAKAGQTDPVKKAEAGSMAHRILDLDDDCDAIYEQRKFYLEHKHLPTTKPLMDLVVDPKKIPTALNNTKRYIRDYRNKLSKEPGNIHAAEKLKQYEWAVAQYEKQLNLD